MGGVFSGSAPAAPAPAVPVATPVATPVTDTKPTNATKPATNATKPATNAIKPATNATKPATNATKPATNATKPATNATKPTTNAPAPATNAPATNATKAVIPSTPSNTPAANGLALAKFTTLLGDLVLKKTGKPLNGRPMNPSTLQLTDLIDKSIVGQYEAILTFCSYFTRLNYEKHPRLVTTMYRFLDYSPITFNTALTYAKYTTLKETKETANPLPPVCGYMLYVRTHDNIASITVHDKPSVMPNDKVVVISFRGTLSIWSTLKDVNATFKNLLSLYGSELFDIKMTGGIGTLGANPFGAHAGFVNGMMGDKQTKGMYDLVVEKLTELIGLHPDITRIIVTGHSLGGAYASLMGLGLAQRKKKGLLKIDNLHTITFGAPKLLTDFARNVFNDLLIEGVMTFDRVTTAPRYNIGIGVTDPFPLIPPIMNHPGFMILKSEMKTQSRTGRTKHVSELRDELANIKANKGILTTLTSRNYSPLPAYPEFLQWFKDAKLFTADEYKGMIETTPNGAIRVGSTDRAKRVRNNVIAMLGITDAQATNATKEAEQVNNEVVAKATVEAPEANKVLAAEGVETAETTVADTAAAVPDPDTDNPTQVGGDAANTTKYKGLTVTYQPNHVVYSCSQITAPLVPVVGCHLGYMGVSGTGTLVGVKLLTDIGYKNFVVLYCNNGIWSYRTDKDISSDVKGNSNPTIVGGRRRTKRRAHRYRQVTRRRRISH